MPISKSSAKKLREIFVGEEVTIFLKDMNVVTVDEEHGSMEITAMAQGHVVDICESYYYLGLPDGMITRTISHETAQMVEIMFIQDDFMDGGFPENEMEIN